MPSHSCFVHPDRAFDVAHFPHTLWYKNCSLHWNIFPPERILMRGISQGWLQRRTAS